MGPCMCGDPCCSSCGPAQGYCGKCGGEGCPACDMDALYDEADRLYDEQRDAKLEVSYLEAGDDLEWEPPGADNFSDTTRYQK